MAVLLGEGFVVIPPSTRRRLVVVRALREQLQKRVCFPHHVERHPSRSSTQLRVSQPFAEARRSRCARFSRLERRLPPSPASDPKSRALAPLRDIARIDTLTPEQRFLDAGLSRHLILDQNLTLMLDAEGPALRRDCQVDPLTHSTNMNPHRRRDLSHRHFITLPVTPREGPELRSVPHVTLTERVLSVSVAAH